MLLIIRNSDSRLNYETEQAPPSQLLRASKQEPRVTPTLARWFRASAPRLALRLVQVYGDQSDYRFRHINIPFDYSQLWRNCQLWRSLIHITGRLFAVGCAQCSVLGSRDDLPRPPYTCHT